ncbi:hypothetical protein CcaverHIS002_0608410 [Cutaneotrichosporon cavernicola]|uniref:DUF3533 domain-containing protein n=1 Tax=Cutaneotrichosporon cavernicola TaxID=279322 RepID=A0AA48L9D9_9TREE|nr:uncharacterized protein CcaverHIS019_0607860 [Cutaneotrichosporon cavernicola]BEI86554.1 hypothetical protein CcaverHIS002_0608410 [Cutaneotrichosporon cavernicola]BEI94327.1 hypothetical protein CcaverHIS019_0607860 [Cutaneotrichosporon cavernicola]BEJ02104.1 hypothetical protein CcaverHIS631_0607860 [Cutaneotrichosporon cavernicola]BEJ09866.1 hypothetical protein CcaverHIS641_0607810 [Cutaneotrichosporon cavernicola]
MSYFPHTAGTSSTADTRDTYEDEARDKFAEDDTDVIFGVPPSRANSPGSPLSARSAPLSPSYSRPGVTRTITQGTVASRISRVVMNPERECAEGRHEEKMEPPAYIKKYAYHFFSPEIKPFRALVLKVLVGVIVITTFIMWAAAPFYWGSLWKANHYTDRLAIRVVDRDGGEIGSAVTAFLLSQRKKFGLGYFVTSPSEFPTDAELSHNIVQEGAWGAVVINAGATANLASARAGGNTSYDGRDAIQFIYAQARNELASGSYMLPMVTAHLNAITDTVGVQSVASFLQSADEAVLRAAPPSTLSSPVGWNIVNLRPYNQPVAQAITLVGLIYMLIFSFICTMANNGAREIISPYLSNKAYITYRIVAPLLLYLPLSLFFAMVSLPFKVSFDAHFTYAGGFFLFWMVMFLGMASVGLATEFLITVIGPKFVSFTLIPLIIANVSVASLPHELQPWIYRYGVAMPFYNCNRAIRAIIFDTKNDLGQNFGILLAWIVFSILTNSVTTYLYRRKAVNEHMKDDGEQEKDIALPDGRVV